MAMTEFKDLLRRKPLSKYYKTTVDKVIIVYVEYGQCKLQPLWVTKYSQRGTGHWPLLRSLLLKDRLKIEEEKKSV